MDRKRHLSVDKFAFGEEYNEVHKWLDSTYPKHIGPNKNPYIHWLERHHLEAIEKQYSRYSIKYNVAYIHVLFDWLNHFQIAFVPKNVDEAKEMLKSCGFY